MELRRTRTQVEIDPVRTERVPTQEAVVGHLVEHSHAAERGVAAIAHERRLALAGHAERTVHGQGSAGDGGVEMAGDVGIQRGQVEAAGGDSQIDLEWLRRGRSDDLEAALAVDDAVKVERD